MNDTSVKLSVVDVEKKYSAEYAEYAYGSSTNTDRPIAWGEDNELGALYWNCYTKSSTLKAIIDSCVNYALGDAINVSDEGAYWAQKVNRRGLTLRQLLEKMFLSLFIYNGYAVQVIYNKLGQVVELIPLDFRKCRINEDASKVFYNKKWGKWTSKYDTYDAFDPQNINMENPTQIFWYKSSSLSNIYPIPMYNGAIYDILTEIESSKYSLNTVTNGFAAKHVIQFPEAGNLTDEQKGDIEKAIKNKFCGPDASASFMLYWRNGDGDADKIEVTKIESDDNAERFLAIRNSVRENIFISCRMTPLLAGLPNIANGFSTQEYQDSLIIFLHNVIQPAQDVVIEGLEKMTGCEGAFAFVPYSTNFTKAE